MTTLSVLGAAGRMGRMLISAAQEFTELKVVAAVEVATSPFLGSDAGELAGIGHLGVPITTQNEAPSADVVIDFTFHTASRANLECAIATEAKGYVLGTTGLTNEEKAFVQEASKQIPIVFAPNFSLGVNLLLDLVKKAASILDTSYDIEIVEMHHKHKKDAPSGTALGLAEAAAEGRNITLSDVALYGREGIVGERKEGEICIHALRGGDVVGDHSVIFATEGERVEITHKASSREAFAKGAMKAALFLPGHAPKIYTMHDVLGL